MSYSNFDEMDIESRDSEHHKQKEEDEMQKDMLKNNLLMKTVDLDDGTKGYCFTRSGDGTNYEIWHCHVCDVKDLWQNIFVHFNSNPHKEAMKRKKHKRINFTRVVDEDIMPEIAKGEPLPPGMENVLSSKCYINKLLANFTKPLIGLEYLLELVMDELGAEHRYLCVLCNKRGDPRSILQHITCVSHYTLYLRKHFPKISQLVNLLPKSTSSKQNVFRVVQHVVGKIEERYGRLKPSSIRDSQFKEEEQRIAITRDMMNRFHVEESEEDSDLEAMITIEYVEKPDLLNVKFPIAVKTVEFPKYTEIKSQPESKENIGKNGNTDEKENTDGKENKSGSLFNRQTTGAKKQLRSRNSMDKNIDNSEDVVFVSATDKNKDRELSKTRNLSPRRSMRSRSRSRRNLRSRSRSRRNYRSRSRSRDKLRFYSRSGRRMSPSGIHGSRYRPSPTRRSHHYRSRTRSPHKSYYRSPPRRNRDSFERRSRSISPRYSRRFRSSKSRSPKSRPSRSPERRIIRTRSPEYYERKKYGSKPRSRSPLFRNGSKSRSRSPRFKTDSKHTGERSVKVLEKPDDENLLERELSSAENEMAVRFDYYKMNPEQHPAYQEEWKKFWNRRYKEVQAEGKHNPNNYDYKPDWINFWNVRMKELFDEELFTKQANIRVKFNESHVKHEVIDLVSENNGTSSPPVENVTVTDIKKTWKALTGSDIKDSNARRSRSDSRSQMSISSGSLHFGSPEKPDLCKTKARSRRTRSYSRSVSRGRSWSRSRSRSFSRSPGRYKSRDEPRPRVKLEIVNVLRQLTVLEVQLGSMASHVVALLTSALAMEKRKRYSSGDILTTENVLFLETCKEKVKAQLSAGIVPKPLVDSAVSAIRNLVDLLKKLPVRSSSPLPIPKPPNFIRPHLPLGPLPFMPPDMLGYRFRSPYPFPYAYPPRYTPRDRFPGQLYDKSKKTDDHETENDDADRELNEREHFLRSRSPNSGPISSDNRQFSYECQHMPRNAPSEDNIDSRGRDSPDHSVSYRNIAPKSNSPIRSTATYDRKSLSTAQDVPDVSHSYNSQRLENPTVDKLAIAQEIAKVLTSQGKTDVTREELEILINCVVSKVNTVDKDGNVETNATTINRVMSEFSDKGIAGICDTSASSSKSGAVDELSDNDLINLLRNFEDLTSSEQSGLITFVQMMNRTNTARIEHLKKYMVSLGYSVDLLTKHLSVVKQDKKSLESNSQKKLISEDEDEDDDNYTLEDVYKAASKNVYGDAGANNIGKEKQRRENKEMRANADTFGHENVRMENAYPEIPGISNKPIDPKSDFYPSSSDEHYLPHRNYNRKSPSYSNYPAEDWPSTSEGYQDMPPRNYSERRSFAAGKSGPYADSKPGPYTDSNPGSYTDIKLGPYADTNPGPYMDSKLGPYADSNPGPYMNSKLGPYADSNPGPYADNLPQLPPNIPTFNEFVGTLLRGTTPHPQLQDQFERCFPERDFAERRTFPEQKIPRSQRGRGPRAASIKQRGNLNPNIRNYGVSRNVSRDPRIRPTY